MNQKHRRADVSFECLALFYSNKADFLCIFISEMKEQSKQCTERGESTLSKVKTVPKAGKVMASVLSSKRSNSQRRVLYEFIAAFK